MSLTQVLEEIKTLKPFAEEDVNSGPVETLSGRRGRRNQAIERLKQLKRQYSKDLLSTAIFIVSTGKNREELEKLATGSFGCFSTDPEEFYNDVSGRVPQSLYLGKESISSIFDVLGRHLEDKMNELDIREYNQLLYKSPYAKKINSTKEFTDLVKKAINQQIGAEIVGVQAVTSLTDVAIEKGHIKEPTPIILSTGDEQLAVDLVKDLVRLTPRVFLLITGESSDSLKSKDGAIILEEVTKDSVRKTILDIKKSLKR